MVRQRVDFFLICSPASSSSSLFCPPPPSLSLRLSLGFPQDHSRGYARRDDDGRHGRRRGLCGGPPKQQQYRRRRRIAGQEERRRCCCVGNVDANLVLSGLSRLRRDGRRFLRAPPPGVTRRGSVSPVLAETVSPLEPQTFSFRQFLTSIVSLSLPAQPGPFLFFFFFLSPLETPGNLTPYPHHNLHAPPPPPAPPQKNKHSNPLPSSRRSLAARAESGAAGGGKRISQNEFTEKAWQAVVAAPDVAKAASNQIVETEHLLKAMLEQPNGLARRCVAAAGGDPSLLLERVDAYIKRQPRVSGDSGQVLGRNLEALVTRAEEVKARMGDDFVSVDHLLLACCDDQRCGAQLLAAAGIPKAKLEEAVKQIRGAFFFPSSFFSCSRQARRREGSGRSFEWEKESF